MSRTDHPSERTLIGIDLDGKVHHVARGRHEAIHEFIGDHFSVHVARLGSLSMSIYLDDEGMLHPDHQLNLAATMIAGLPIFQPVVIASGEVSPSGETLPCAKPTRDFIMGMASMAEAILANADAVGQQLRIPPNPATVPGPRLYVIDPETGVPTEVPL